MIPRDVQRITEKNLLEPILGIFQKLVSTKMHESLAFDLIEMIIASIPLAALQPYFGTIISLMLTRLSNSKTENFQQRFIVFYHFVSARQDKGMGADFFIKVSDQVQQE
jgi:exportin-2 (importin alpha re-exporter)